MYLKPITLQALDTLPISYVNDWIANIMHKSSPLWLSTFNQSAELFSYNTELSDLIKTNTDEFDFGRLRRMLELGSSLEPYSIYCPGNFVK